MLRQSEIATFQILPGGRGNSEISLRNVHSIIKKEFQFAIDDLIVWIMTTMENSEGDKK